MRKNNEQKGKKQGEKGNTKRKMKIKGKNIWKERWRVRVQKAYHEKLFTYYRKVKNVIFVRGGGKIWFQIPVLNNK